MAKTNPVANYAKKLAPFKQGDRNLAPVVKPTASKSPFSSALLNVSKITKSASDKLQQASKLVGRVALKDSSQGPRPSK